MKKMLARLRSWALASPLMVLTLAAVLGILAAEHGWLGMEALWLAAGAAFLLLLAVRFTLVWPLVAGCALVFAFIHHTRQMETFQHPLRRALQQVDRPLEAVIQGSLLPEFDNTSDRRVHALCALREIVVTETGDRVPQEAVVMVRLPQGVRFPGAGLYELRGRLSLPRAAGNPGGFDMERYALRLGRVARFDVNELKRVGDSGQEWWGSFLEAAERCRQWISLQLNRDLEGDPETAAVIRAMALGVSAEAADEIEDAFRDSGTLHVFAVSGLHVALLGLIALILLRQLGVPRAASLALMMGLVFAYAFVTGWRPSAARAAFMVAVFTCATFSDRQSSLQNSLGAAALILLSTDTHQLFMPGFQLSFGVLWLSALGSAPVLKRLLPFTELDPFLPRQLANWRQLAWSWCRRWLATTLSVSFAAWIGSLPFILGHFQSVTPVAVFANCVLVPLSFFCLAATCLSLCAAVMHATGIQILFNNLNWFFAKGMILSAAWFADLPGANFHFQPDMAQHEQAPAPAVWRVLKLPNGGAANHVRVGEAHWLFDTGEEASFRPVLKAYFRSSGVNDLAGVFLSHNDPRHIGAVAQVIAAYEAPPIYCSTQEPGPQDLKRAPLRVLAESPQAGLLRKLGLDERVALSDDPRFKVVAQVLHPAPDNHDGRSDDRAMVMMLHVGPWRVLWMNDAGWTAEKMLCAGGADLRCDVLIRSQHGRDHAPTAEFLIKAAPRAIVCGSDERTAATALPAELVAFAKERGIALFDTWTDGSVEVRFGADAIELVPYVDRREVVRLGVGERAE